MSADHTEFFAGINLYSPALNSFLATYALIVSLGIKPFGNNNYCTVQASRTNRHVGHRSASPRRKCHTEKT